MSEWESGQGRRLTESGGGGGAGGRGEGKGNAGNSDQDRERTGVAGEGENGEGGMRGESWPVGNSERGKGKDSRGIVGVGRG